MRKIVYRKYEILIQNTIRQEKLNIFCSSRIWSVCSPVTSAVNCSIHAGNDFFFTIISVWTCVHCICQSYLIPLFLFLGLWKLDDVTSILHLNINIWRCMPKRRMMFQKHQGVLYGFKSWRHTNRGKLNSRIFQWVERIAVMKIIVLSDNINNKCVILKIFSTSLWLTTLS